MKRWFALLLIAVLCLNLPALAENPLEAAASEAAAPAPALSYAALTGALAEPEPTFMDALLMWSEKLDPARCDLSGAITLGDFSQSATVRQDGALYEIAIADLATVQFDSQALVIRTGDQTLRLDLEPLLSGLSGLTAPSPEDLALFENLLIQAAQEVLLPSVSFNPYGRFMNLHVSLNSVQFWDRFHRFVDNALAGEAGERLYALCGDTLGTLIPDFPESAQALREVWSKVELYPPYYRTADAVELDAQIDPYGLYGPELVCVGAIRDRWGSAMALNLEYTSNEDGFSLSAGLEQRWNTVLNAVSIALDAHGNSLTGSLTSTNYGGVTRFDFTAGLLDLGVHGELSCFQDDQRLWLATLDLDVDPYEKIVSGTLTCIDDYSSPDAPMTLAALDARYWSGGCSGTLELPGDRLSFRAASGRGFTRLSIDERPASDYLPAHSCDLWLFKQGWSSYRARLDAKTLRSGRLIDQVIVNGSASTNAFRYDVNWPLQRRFVEGELQLSMTPGRYAVDMAFSDNAPSRYLLYESPTTAFNAHLALGAEGLDASFENTDPRLTTRGSLRLVPDSAGGISQFAAEYAQSAPDAPELTNLRLTWTPGTAALTVGADTYTLERTADTNRELAWRLTGTSFQEAVSFGASLDDALRTFSAWLRLDDTTLAGLEITAGDKTPIVPIDAEAAAPIDADLVRTLIDPPAPTPAPTAEPVSEQVEEAIEG